MKQVLCLFMLFFVSHVYGGTLSLTYQDHFLPKKIMGVNNLPVYYRKLHKKLLDHDKRMIAGKFEHQLPRVKKSTYLDDLRSRLSREGCFVRF